VRRISFNILHLWKLWVEEKRGEAGKGKDGEVPEKGVHSNRPVEGGFGWGGTGHQLMFEEGESGGLQNREEDGKTRNRK